MKADGCSGAGSSLIFLFISLSCSLFFSLALVHFHFIITNFPLIGVERLAAILRDKNGTCMVSRRMEEQPARTTVETRKRGGNLVEPLRIS